ncbi:hypothetical protein L4F92_05200 [Avibacterium sp. 21-595]|uniref:phage minor head protein n=1 Tax=Avibacterium sp. 21-595 TaxID=2911527 RepID=UPI002026C1EA|nr:phage minor head protein [Avibacterium sp. 21-595]URL07494.1 hypothetical protein L4F92_05200 [Avibacterium sp. 21-595]
MRDNVDSRPYWQYSAVNDDRTRPSHSAMNGLVYAYDDPSGTPFTRLMALIAVVR